MANQKLSLTRDQFASFLQDFEQIKQFERLFSTTDANSITIDEVNISAGYAGASANDALAQMIELSETLNKEPTPANVSQLAVVQSDLQSLALSPAPRSGVAPPSEGGTGTSTQFTTGSVVFAGASGVYSQDNANFFWDNTNDRLGIGTSSPNGKVGSAANFGNGVNVNFLAQALGTAQGQLAGYSFRPTFQGTGDNGPRRAADIWTGFNGGGWGTEFLAIGVGNNGSANDAANITSEKVRITNIGDVLIGSTSGTGAKLNVTGLIRSRTGAATTDVNHDGLAGSLASSSSLFLYANGANPLVLHTNTIERMRIGSSGNVGIGISSPSTKLEVAGTIRSRGSGGEGGQLTLNNAANTAAAYFFDVDASGHGRVFTTTNNTNLSLGQLSGTGGETLLFTGGSERMRIKASGNVGIGTNAPNASAILDVQSTTKGFRLPNMTTTQKNAISSPAAGLMVFDTTLSKACVYSGSAWETITSV